jgi:hypothetical protein
MKSRQVNCRTNFCWRRRYPRRAREVAFGNMKSLFILLLLLAVSATARANTYLAIDLEKIPKGSDIAAFTNGPRPGRGTRKKLSQEEIALFLDEGVVNRERRNWSHPRTRTSVGQSDGVFFDRAGIAYFWRIVMPGVLFLETAEGAAARLELPGQMEKEPIQPPETTPASAPR